MKIEAKNDLFFILICAICLFNGLTDAEYMSAVRDLLKNIDRTV